MTHSEFFFCFTRLEKHIDKFIEIKNKDNIKSIVKIRYNIGRKTILILLNGFYNKTISSKKFTKKSFVVLIRKGYLIEVSRNEQEIICRLTSKSIVIINEMFVYLDSVFKGSDKFFYGMDADVYTTKFNYLNNPMSEKRLVS